MSTNKILDISIPLNENTVTYPGNPKVSITEQKGQTSVHSKILLGSHTGTHIDAPKHVFPGSGGVDSIPLESLVGKCRVVDFTHAEQSINVDDIERANIKKGERILAKTKNSDRGFDTFYDDYVYLDGDAAELLVEKDIALFGIDYFSIKKRGGPDNRPHTELLKNNIVIFEGLDLSRVEEGRYFFIGLPLKFIGIDGSPARAILLQNFKM